MPLSMGFFVNLKSRKRPQLTSSMMAFISLSEYIGRLECDASQISVAIFVSSFRCIALWFIHGTHNGAGQFADFVFFGIS